MLLAQNPCHIHCLWLVFGCCLLSLIIEWSLHPKSNFTKQWFCLAYANFVLKQLYEIRPWSLFLMSPLGHHSRRSRPTPTGRRKRTDDTRRQAGLQSRLKNNQYLGGDVQDGHLEDPRGERQRLKIVPIHTKETNRKRWIRRVSVFYFVIFIWFNNNSFKTCIYVVLNTRFLSAET